mmetsp:Transcript_9739/g.39445  ORF Transcript_9739/g.39445 Transcript_9739/m.39445 type:complete len:279 (-) Transcript_9739:346-1182(-)
MQRRRRQPQQRQPHAERVKRSRGRRPRRLQIPDPRHVHVAVHTEAREHPRDAAGPTFDALKLLGGAVRRVEDGFRSVRALPSLVIRRAAEVHHQHARAPRRTLLRRREQHVVRLDVSVHDVGVVDGDHRLDEPARDGDEHFRIRQSSLLSGGGRSSLLSGGRQSHLRRRERQRVVEDIPAFTRRARLRFLHHVRQRALAHVPPHEVKVGTRHADEWRHPGAIAEAPAHGAFVRVEGEPVPSADVAPVLLQHDVADARDGPGVHHRERTLADPRPLDDV